MLARSFSTVDAPPRFCRRPPKKSMPAAQKVARCARGGSCASASGEAAATLPGPERGAKAEIKTETEAELVAGAEAELDASHKDVHQKGGDRKDVELPS